MSYMMNYNWHKKFQKKSKVNHNELYLLGLAEQNKRKKELENQKKVKYGFLINKIILTGYLSDSQRKKKRKENWNGGLSHIRGTTRTSPVQ